MKQPFLTAVILASPLAGVLQAADAQLLGLVMPDAKILAGVNVTQAKGTLFGQFLITQIKAQDQHLSDLITQTGFDPTQDLEELLVASNGAQSNASHLVLARGTFDAGKIDAAAKAGGATSETYKSITIVENPKRGDGFAFLNPTLAVAGGIADVKGAIDRCMPTGAACGQTAPATLDAALSVANQLSWQDAWAVSEVPPPAIKAPANAPNVPAIPSVPSTIFQNIQQAQGGVKFGTDVVVTAELTADTAQNATAAANVLQFLVNLGQMQAQQNAQAAAALKSVIVSATGNVVNITASVPEAQVEAAFQLKPHPKLDTPPGPRRERRL